MVLSGIQSAEVITDNSLSTSAAMTDFSAVKDDDLLEGMVAGSEEAFMVLYERRQSSVYRFALQMTGSVSTAEDITQDVFLTIIRAARNFDREKGSAGAFLYGIARNLVLKRFEIERNYLPIAHEDGGEGSEIQGSLQISIRYAISREQKPSTRYERRCSRCRIIIVKLWSSAICTT